MTIHSEHPFAGQGPSDEVRRLRARLGGVVTLWTTGEGESRAGLTVSSLMVARGDEGRVLALVDPLSGFAEEFDRTGQAVVQVLRWSHREVADAFAGLSPAPGGPFRVTEFEQHPHGPRMLSAGTWAAVEHESATEVGWSTLFTTRIVDLHVDDETDPLVHRRGRYRRASEVEPPLGE